jgi:predicted DNA-binding protein
MEKKLTIRLSSETYKRVKVLIAEKGITLGTFIDQAITIAEAEVISPEYETYLAGREHELETEIKKGTAKEITNINDLFKDD